jgi:uncharacterized protein (DUF2249 family)
MQTNNTSVANKSSVPARSPAPLELDIRPIFAAGSSPCGTIDKAVASLKSGQTFVLLAPFEPIPLFTKLAAQGFEHTSEPLGDGSFRIVFEREGDAPADAPKHQSCCCSEEP